MTDSPFLSKAEVEAACGQIRKLAADHGVWRLQGSSWDHADRLQRHCEALDADRNERINSQTHAEELLQQISAFLTGWTFASLDPECGEEADALEASINTLLAYGWPHAQHAHVIPAALVGKDSP